MHEDVARFGEGETKIVGYRGLFDRAGLDVELIATSTGAAATEAVTTPLMRGSIESLIESAKYCTNC